MITFLIIATFTAALTAAINAAKAEFMAARGIKAA